MIVAARARASARRQESLQAVVSDRFDVCDLLLDQEAIQQAKSPILVGEPAAESALGGQVLLDGAGQGAAVPRPSGFHSMSSASPMVSWRSLWSATFP